MAGGSVSDGEVFQWLSGLQKSSPQVMHPSDQFPLKVFADKSCAESKNKEIFWGYFTVIAMERVPKELASSSPVPPPRPLPVPVWHASLA